MARHFLPLSLLLVAHVPAQTVKVIPPQRATTEGNASSALPFALVGGRVQQVYDGAAIARAAATITSLSFRRDGGMRVSSPGRRIPALKLTFGYAANSPTTMVRNFARNRKGTQTVVFNGAYALPPQQPGRGVGPFNITIKANQPFRYLRAQGDFLAEIEMPGNSGNRLFYYLHDAEKSTTVQAGFKKFGTAGPFQGGDSYELVSDATVLKPGGAVTLTARGLKRAYPALGAFGFSNSQWGAFRLPLDLRGAGAAGNFVYVSLDLLLPLPLQQSGSTFQGSSKVGIPSDPAFAGGVLFGQAIFFDPPSNALDLVFSNGVEMTIGGDVPPPFQMVWARDSTLAAGNFLLAGSVAGNVTQLAGTFN